MQKVLIDSFIVPEDSRPAFLEQARKAQGFIKTLPGFVEGFIYEQTGGESRYNILTTAVWESETAFEAAKQSVTRAYQQQGFNPQEMMQQLGIERVRATYERFTY